MYNNDGSGANVYILDTGVRLSHSEFGGRAQYVPNGNNGDFVNDGHGSAADCHGHGTHVAGTAAGANFGVAKNAAVWAGRVVNCAGSGQVSMAIAGVDWVTANAVRPAVVNMSLGYGNVQSLRDAVQSSVAGGVNYSVAAGNGNFFGRPRNACNESPAGAPDALTVGATQSNDVEASFSNYGPCVDFLAPGVNITPAWHTSDNATNTISGTSMATPHVTGAVAQYLSANPDHPPAQAANALVGNAVPNTITLHRRSQTYGTPNRLLNVQFIGPAGNQLPNASFTVSCDLLTCTFDGSGSSDADGAIASYGWTFGDGETGSGVMATHTYTMDGTYEVTLTVADDEGATGSDTQNVSVSGVPNVAPTASFTFSCVDLNCDFDASGSFDSDGSIVSYSWNFGDGSTGIGPVPSHTYGAEGSYTVTLMVMDDDTATDTVSDDVTVTAPPPPTIVLTASGFSFFGIKVAELSWSPVTSANIDIYRNGSLHDSGPNIGMYSEVHTTPGLQFSYFVCEAGTSVCSNTVTLVY